MDPKHYRHYRKLTSEQQKQMLEKLQEMPYRRCLAGKIAHCLAILDDSGEVIGFIIHGTSSFRSRVELYFPSTLRRWGFTPEEVAYLIERPIFTNFRYSVHKKELEDGTMSRELYFPGRSRLRRE